MRRIERDPSLNAGLTAASRAIALENKWRAQRYGVHGSFVDEARRRLISVSDLLDETISLVDEDMRALGCTDQVHALRSLAAGGTSADRQLAIHMEQTGSGNSNDAALIAVVDWLAAASAVALMLRVRESPR